MPVPDISSTGLGPAPTTASSSRKEKKKQAKEERDRLKQVEKKKRRLEKALATATAIRIELEKKKQKRKEEEQRLDEEGAALAEAVALQVLVGEDVDVLDDSSDSEDVCHDKHGSLDSVNEVEGLSKPQRFENGSKSLLQTSEAKSKTCHAAAQMEAGTLGGDIFNRWELSTARVLGNFERDQFAKLQELQAARISLFDEKAIENPEDNLKASNERAKAAELAAGMAAAQAVAALRIAEEARAEAEAAKRAAEAAISQVLDRKQVNNMVLPQVTFQSRNIELERDELRARLEETERQLKEKTRQVVHLEQNLEDMTHYLLQLKEKIPFLMVGERQGETSERDSTNLTESSGGTVDQ